MTLKPRDFSYYREKYQNTIIGTIVLTGLAIFGVISILWYGFLLLGIGLIFLFDNLFIKRRGGTGMIVSAFFLTLGLLVLIYYKF